jgi:putative zinc finger/helix-turn-helix YgiT family protein
MNCPACGRQPSHTVEQYQYRESGLDNVFVRGVGIYRCKCGQEYVQLPGAQEVHDQVASALLNKASILTGPESKFLRKWLRLTSEDMAQALGYTRVTVSRWENYGPSAKTDRALRLYASAVRKTPINFEILFSSMNDKPQKNFRIVVDGIRTAPQYSAGVSMSASAVMAAWSSNQETLADFRSAISVTAETAQAANHELAQAA